MYYNIHFACVSHIGNIRSINQDNFICDGSYMEINDNEMEFPLCGKKYSDDKAIFGIFDGMGGEECGEVASYIASKVASTIMIDKDAISGLSKFCQKANDEICDYAKKYEVSSMGTTAAMLAFTEKEVVLCNIGDSKIFQFSNGVLEQISKDHVALAPFGMKPPLSQNLGIPPNELIIDPYFARGEYNDGDVYLICSDGLTDMVSTVEITELLDSKTIDEAVMLLLEKALANGGRDNTSIIICRIERQSGLFSKWKRRKDNTRNK